jgi:hypothetical protein
VLNSNTIYYSSIFAKHIASTKFMKILCKVSWIRNHLHVGWSHIPDIGYARTQNRPPTSRLQKLSPNAVTAIPRNMATMRRSHFLLPEYPHSELHFSSIPHRTNSTLAESSVKDFDYCISSRYILLSTITSMRIIYQLQQKQCVKCYIRNKFVLKVGPKTN